MIQDVRGDEIVAVFESETDAVLGGLAMLRSLREHNCDRLAHGSQELQVGIGINTGPVGVGLVGGVNRMVLTIIGDAVNVAARIESTNKRYGTALLISDAVDFFVHLERDRRGRRVVSEVCEVAGWNGAEVQLNRIFVAGVDGRARPQAHLSDARRRRLCRHGFQDELLLNADGWWET